jgi:ABC-2 type transport system permease protein
MIAIIAGAASVALGLILAAISKNEEQAGSIGPAVTVPLSFLTGAFFPMPTVILSDNFLGTGKSFELFDWLPWTQCSKALSKVLIYGSSFDEIKMDMALLITFTIVFFIIGVILYHNRRLRAI